MKKIPINNENKRENHSLMAESEQIICKPRYQVTDLTRSQTFVSGTRVQNTAVSAAREVLRIYVKK